MPESVDKCETMSAQDSDGSFTVETPDQSLGSISLNAIGEQLDDMQDNFDRMYLESPAPSLLAGNSDPFGRNLVTPVSRNIIKNNVLSGVNLSEDGDCSGFDSLQLLEVEKLDDALGESENWLVDPPGTFPVVEDENDWSFLDTGLMNVRFSLLNYVTRMMAEEACAETKRNSPSSSSSSRTNLINATAGSGATIRIKHVNDIPTVPGDSFSREIDTRTYTRPKKTRMSLASTIRSPLNTTMELTTPEPANHCDETLSPVPHRLLNATITRTPGRAAKLGSFAYHSPKLNATLDLSDPDDYLEGAGDAPGQLNTTIDLPCNDLSPSATSPAGNLNETFNADNGQSPQVERTTTLGRFSSPKLNTTIDVTPDRKNCAGSRMMLNATIELPNGGGDSGSPTSPMNLNETFSAENGQSPSTEKSRRVTRNLSYVIRSEEESPNNNSSPQVSTNTSRSDLNNTFSFEGETDREAQGTRSSHNTSMEDLNSRVASQIRSLGCSTVTRTRYSDITGRAGPNLDETRLVARTSSTDTYSVAHSSESPTSSGLSSPMDAQSYDDIQSSSEAVRRSMPNLAVIRSASGIRSNYPPAFPQVGAGQLRKNNHYISDSRLSRLGNGESRPRLRIHGSDSAQSSFNQGLSPVNGPRHRGGSNTSTPASLNRISSGITSVAGATRVNSAQALGSPNSYSRTSSTLSRPAMGNVRPTGVAPPRYTGGLRPPRPSVLPNTALQQPAVRSFQQPGIPVPTARFSRIPAPGQLRFSRPPQVHGSRFGQPPKGANGSQKGSGDDWRDGCY